MRRNELKKGTLSSVANGDALCHPDEGFLNEWVPVTPALNILCATLDRMI